MKLTKDQKLEIENLRSKGLKQSEIAKIIGTSQPTISYWLLSEEKRKEKSKRECERFRRLPKERRSEVYERRKDYLRKYMRNYNKSKSKNIKQ